MKLIKTFDTFLAMNAWVVALVGTVLSGATVGLAGKGFETITSHLFNGVYYSPNSVSQLLVLAAGAVFVLLVATALLALPVLVGVRRNVGAGLKVFAAQVVLAVVLLSAVTVYYVSATNSQSSNPPYGHCIDYC